MRIVDVHAKATSSKGKTYWSIDPTAFIDGSKNEIKSDREQHGRDIFMIYHREDYKGASSNVNRVRNKCVDAITGEQNSPLYGSILVVKSHGFVLAL